MKLNITPGPWYFSKGEFNGEQHNETALGSIRAKTEWNWVIAEVQSSCWENQIEEDKESYDNAAAIVTAVNNTYHKGINPEAVPELLQLVEEIYKSELLNPWVQKRLNRIIQKATLCLTTS